MRIGNYLTFLLYFCQEDSGNNRQNASWEKNGPRTTALVDFVMENGSNITKDLYFWIYHDRLLLRSLYKDTKVPGDITMPVKGTRSHQSSPQNGAAH